MVTSPGWPPPTPTSTGPVVHAEDLRARAQQLTHGYRDGLA
ncbi:hypothetical protein [Salinifilum aidingensis]